MLLTGLKVHPLILINCESAMLLCFHCNVCPDQIGRNPGLQAIWEDEKHRRRENNQGSQIDTPDSQGEQNHNLICP